MEPQHELSNAIEGAAVRGPKRPRRYQVRARGTVPDDLGLRVAELHAAALAMASASPPPASQKLEKSGGVEHDTGNEEEV